MLQSALQPHSNEPPLKRQVIQLGKGFPRLSSVKNVTASGQTQSANFLGPLTRGGDAAGPSEMRSLRSGGIEEISNLYHAGHSQTGNAELSFSRFLKDLDRSNFVASLLRNQAC